MKTGNCPWFPIEIINARGTRLRFYNLKVDQSWLRHVGNAEGTAHRPDVAS
jgi:hypothetical protein